MKFEGIYAPVITPMDEDRAVDESGYAVMIEQLIGQGIHGLVIGGTTGENYALTEEERVRQFAYADAGGDQCGAGAGDRFGWGRAT